MNIELLLLGAYSTFSPILFSLLDLLKNAFIQMILGKKYTFSSTEEHICMQIVDKLKSKQYFYSSGDYRIFKENMIPTGIIFGYDFIADIKIIKNANLHGENKLDINISLWGQWSFDAFSITIHKKNDHFEKWRYDCKYIRGEGYFPYTRNQYYMDEEFHENTKEGASLILKDITSRSFGNGIYLLYGETGTGKSTTILQLYKKYEKNEKIEIFYVHENSIKILNNELKQIYVSTEKNMPIFILLDEIDSIFSKIGDKENTVETVKNQWNAMTDIINRMPNIILICTTNKDISYFNNLCPSLFRKHRVNAIFHYTKNGVKQMQDNDVNPVNGDDLEGDGAFQECKVKSE